jgi:hypothetical protein
MINKIKKIFLQLYNDRIQLLFLSLLGYISYLTQDLIPSDPNVNQAFLPIAMAAGGLAQAAMGFDWGGKRRKAAARAKKAFEKQKAIYQNLDTSVSNPYANLTNQYADMENTMEDLTVNQQQAQFERQMFQQSQADTLAGLRGAAGSSGIAGLAQALSNQAQTQAQRASASIGQQEARNQLLAAQQEAKIDQLQAGEASKIQQLKAAGAMKAEITSMQMEQSKQGTLLGMDAQAYQGAQQAVMQGKQMMAQGLSSAIGGIAGGMQHKQLLAAIKS